MATCAMLTGDPTRGTCHLCARPLPKRCRRWCSLDCETIWRENHLWTVAREAARRRVLIVEDDCAGYRCESCGNLTIAPEVNHRTPILGKHGQTGCWHHLDGLQVLCHGCHGEVTRRQRAVGWRAVEFGSPATAVWVDTDDRAEAVEQLSLA